MKGPLFYSKILLFGEYGIIKDSKGLAIPYSFYNGALKVDALDSEQKKSSNESLRKFVEHLEHLTKFDEAFASLDIENLKKDIEAGLYFDSSIPKGYGVGSSGALVAAIYEDYFVEKITVLENLSKDKLLKLKDVFSKMESFFHGTSSGLDPLNSYLSLPIVINSQNHIETAGIPTQNAAGKGGVFLLDTEQIGETAPMVSIFMENLKNEGFRNMMKSQFAKYTNTCVDSFLKGDFKEVYKNTKQLSKLALNHFKPMIPEKLHKIWQQGIDSNDYYLKLCGSGGGGYILGFAFDFEKAKQLLKNYKLELVYRF